MKKLKERNIDISIRLSVGTLGLTDTTLKNRLQQNFVLPKLTSLNLTIKNSLTKKTRMRKPCPGNYPSGTCVIVGDSILKGILKKVYYRNSELIVSTEDIYQ